MSRVNTGLASVPEQNASLKGACRLPGTRFATDDRGNVAVLFAMTTMIVVSCVGGAVDYGRWLSARYQTQNAIDAALLAAGRVAQTSSGSATEAEAAANAYYAQMKSKIIVDDSITFSAVNSATSFNAKGTAYVATPFLSMVGIERLPVLATVDVVQATSTIAQEGSNSGYSLEVSLMLDTTGSMSGQKMADMKLAAKDLVDIVIWQDQSVYSSKVALAPFSSQVNVGDYFQAVTNQNPVGASRYVYPPSCYNTNGTLKNNCKNKSQYLVVDNVAKAKCVNERTGSAEYTDAAPGPNTWVTAFNDARAAAYANLATLQSAGAVNTGEYDSLNDVTTTTCPERSPIVPLTSDKTKLKTAIDGFVAERATAGFLGTAWAWYLLSPNWNNVFTGEAKPLDYAKLTELNNKGEAVLQKIAVLMTDGVYNTYQGVQYSDNSSKSTEVENRTKTMCQAMRAKGIKVVTIGFQLTDTSATAMLKNCSTPETNNVGQVTYPNFYNAANGDELRGAFRNIALQLVPLRISH